MVCIPDSCARGPVTRLVRRLLSTAIAALLFATPGMSETETMTPISAEYEFEAKEDALAKACNIVLFVFNFAPETVNFKVVITRAKTGGRETYVGFTFDVEDLVLVNGVPTFRKATLLTAAFDSPTFTSTGRLRGGQTGDGGFFGTTLDAATARAFLEALYRGGFELSFNRQGAATERSYKIASGPTSEIRKQVDDCAHALN